MPAFNALLAKQRRPESPAQPVPAAPPAVRQEPCDHTDHVLYRLNLSEWGGTHDLTTWWRCLRCDERWVTLLTLGNAAMANAAYQQRFNELRGITTPVTTAPQPIQVPSEPGATAYAADCTECQLYSWGPAGQTGPWRCYTCRSADAVPVS